MSFFNKVMKIFSTVNPTSTDVKLNGTTDMLPPKESLETDGSIDRDAQMPLSTELSKDFPLYEFTNSNTATRLGIDNTKPSKEVVVRLTVLAKSLLQPLRNRIKKPVIITSGYRCLELNRSLGSKDNSQHVLGEAVDIYVPGYTALELARFILTTGLEFDQLILENYEGPGTGWVHISRKAAGNRNQVLTYDGEQYHVGIKV